jgi:hypothetical protein
MQPVKHLLDAVQVRLHRAIVQFRFFVGDTRSADHFLELFRRATPCQPVRGTVGKLRGYSSQTAVADFDLASPVTDGSSWGDGRLVVKFELYPGHISSERLAMERRNERLARQFLDEFMPVTLRIIGHGIGGRSSALVYQRRVPGKLLRHTSWRELRENAPLQANLVKFCDQVTRMGQELGRIPDLAGTLPHIDHITNLFWRSRNIMVDPPSGQVWLVDTGWKDGQELLSNGPLRQRLRTRFRLATLRFFRWRVMRLRGQYNPLVEDPLQRVGKKDLP